MKRNADIDPCSGQIGQMELVGSVLTCKQGKFDIGNGKKKKGRQANGKNPILEAKLVN
jgi:hypothetical protein